MGSIYIPTSTQGILILAYATRAYDCIMIMAHVTTSVAYTLISFTYNMSFYAIMVSSYAYNPSHTYISASLSLMILV